MSCGSVLWIVSLAPIGPAVGNPVLGAELAGRQSGRHARPASQARTAAIWVLRRPHRRHHCRILLNVRIGLFWICPSSNCVRNAGFISDAFDRSVLVYLHSRSLPAVLLEVGAYRNKNSAGS